MSAEPLKFSGDKITGDDTLCLTVNHDEVEHFVTRIAGHGTSSDLTVQSSISSEEELLTGLSTGIECTTHLDTSERTVGKITTVFPCERNSLRNTLVDNGCAYLGKTIHVGFTAAVVSSFDSIVEETIDSIVVILVVLCSIDTSLCCNGVCPTGRVTDTEDFDVVAKLSERSSCGRATKARSDNYNLELSPVVGIDKTKFRLTFGPFFSQRSVRNL